MALEYNSNLELIETIFYTKTLYNDPAFCLICHHDETEESPEIWDRYALKCGHKFHTRCLRRWHYIKNCINCPLCGDIDANDQNNFFCGDCQEFGHHCTDCPKMKQYLFNYTAPKKGRKKINNLIACK